MTSAINYAAIDELYPVAGVNNDSQGFRDNFSYIKTGLEVASVEITNLQNNSAKLNEINDFNGSLITNAVTNVISNLVHNANTITENTDVSLQNGSYQLFIIGADLAFRIIDWPQQNDICSKVRIVIKGDGSNRTISFATQGSSSFRKSADFPTQFTTTVVTDSNNNTIIPHKIVDAWSDDKGKTIYLQYVGEFV